MISLSFWLDAIRYRWKTVAAAVAASLVLTLAYILVTPQSYTASATLFFDTNSPAPLENESPTAVADNLETEMDIVRSASGADRVVADLVLTDDEKLQEEWRQSGSDIPHEQWLSMWVSESVSVKSSGKSRVVSVDATAPLPQEATQLANAYARAARTTLLSFSPNAASGYLDQLREETAQAHEDVNAAERELQTFVAATGITNNGDLSAEAMRGADIQVQAAAAQAQAAGARNLSGVTESAIEATERSAAIQAIRTELATKQSELSRLASTKGPNHPQLLSAQAEVDMLQSNLEREREATIAAFRAGRAAENASLQASTGATAGRLTSAAAQQNSRMVEMSKNIGRMSTLQTELATAQNHYAQLQGRLQRMELEQDVPQVTVQHLDEATTPLVPTSPKVGLLLVCAAFLGLVVGAAIAIVLETVTPYVRNPASLQEALGIPVIGRLSLPKGTVRQLIDARSSS